VFSQFGDVQSHVWNRKARRVFIDRQDRDVIAIAPFQTPGMPQTLQAGQTVLEKYKVIKRLGIGRTGEVYQMINCQSGRNVAMKYVRGETQAREAAQREMKAQTACQHPHVVDTLAFHPRDQYSLIEMEFMHDGSLADALARRFVPLAESVGYTRQVLDGLTKVHHMGVVHRDVGAENVMLSGEIAKLTDFGAAFHMPTGRMVSDLVYKPYIPPETTPGDGSSPSWDIFDAGLMLLRSVNNMASFHQTLTDARQTLERDQNVADVIGFADYVPERIRRIVRKAVSFDPQDRFTSVAEFKRALDQLSFARQWVRVGSDQWICGDGDRREILALRPGMFPALTHTVGTKRQAFSTFRNETEARSRIAAIVAKSTLR
jgi:eukaryotic-like serine/threonine-protein kinase